MSDELPVIEEDKPRRNLNKIYITAGILGGCILVLFMTSGVAVGSHVTKGNGSSGRGAASTSLNVNGVCRSRPCHVLGERLNISLSSSEQPCSNFYRFVCGGRNSSRPSGADTLGIDEKWTDNALHKAFHKVGNNPQVPVKGQTEAQKFLAFYLSCCHSLAPRAHNVKSLRRFLQFFNFSWPKVRVNQPHAFDLLVRMELEYNTGAFFRFGISLKRVNAWDFTLKPPKMSKFVYSPSRKESYTNYVDKVVKLMYRGMKHSSMANAISSMEEELFQLAVMQDKQRISVHSLNQLTPTIPPVVWMKTFGKYFALSKFFENHTILVRSPQYFRLLFNSLSKKEGALYLGWRIVRHAGCFTHQLRALEEATQLNVDSCSQPLRKTRSFCRLYASRMMMPQFLAFTTESLTNRDQVQSVRTIVENVQRSISTGISLNPWLDDTTRTAALQKLNNIRHVFPEIGVANESRLMFPDMGPDFLQNWARVAPNANIQPSDTAVGDAVKRLYQDHVRYDAFNNELHIPVSSTKLPFSSSELASSANYALLGRIVAHEILHSLDAQGRNVDGTGRSTLWWSKNFTDVYNARAACYEGRHVGVRNYTKATTVEDIMDSAAVRYAYGAYKTAPLRDKLGGVLEGLEGFNAQQTFFVSYCYRFCDDSPDYVGAHGGTAEYSERENRCNLPLINMEEFSHAFSCTPKDPMDPSHRCYLW